MILGGGKGSNFNFVDFEKNFGGARVVPGWGNG